MTNIFALRKKANLLIERRICLRQIMAEINAIEVIFTSEMAEQASGHLLEFFDGDEELSVEIENSIDKPISIASMSFFHAVCYDDNVARGAALSFQRLFELAGSETLLPDSSLDGVSDVERGWLTRAYEDEISRHTRVLEEAHSLWAEIIGLREGLPLYVRDKCLAAAGPEFPTFRYKEGDFVPFVTIFGDDSRPFLLGAFFLAPFVGETKAREVSDLVFKIGETTRVGRLAAAEEA